ncbi:uncharacterized protein LOC143521224 isoform X4 [Brachyhypopomus gauderio]|uniref:uncharacterized protein LOC143521224 isoform X4 n=1 Tax=Brachyhypopomus gauderio TaxID=698409 RepID=UPI0040431FD2
MRRARKGKRPSRHHHASSPAHHHENPVTLDEMWQDPVVALLLRQAQATNVESLAEQLHQDARQIWKERHGSPNRDSAPLTVGFLELCSVEKTPESGFEREEDSEEKESSPPSMYSAPTEYYGEGEEEEVSPPPSVYSAPTEYHGESEEEEGPPPSVFSGDPTESEGEDATPPLSECTEYSDGEPCTEEDDLSLPPLEYSGETVRGRRGPVEDFSPYPSEGSAMDCSRAETPVQPMIWRAGGEEEEMEVEYTAQEARSGEQSPGGSGVS